MSDPWRLKGLLELAVAADASSLHLHSGLPAVAMAQGQLVPLTEQRLTPEDCQSLVATLLECDPDGVNQARHHGEEPELCRFRAEVYRQRDALSLVFKLTPWRSRALGDLRLPPLSTVLQARSGLVLVSGPRGSGKSWTLAGLLESLHQNRSQRSLVIGDPIEFKISPKRGMVTEHSITDGDWKGALTAAESGDIDVVVLDGLPGNCELETVLTMVEAGTLVLASVRESLDSYCALCGLWERYPIWHHQGLRTRVSQAIEAVLFQKLVPKARGGRIPAVEVAIATPLMRSLLEEDRCIQYYNHLQTGARYGMQTLEQSLFHHFREGLIDEDTALEQTRYPEDMSRMISAWRER